MNITHLSIQTVAQSSRQNVKITISVQMEKNKMKDPVNDIKLNKRMCQDKLIHRKKQ